jgi:hypothetical protein
MDPRRHEGDPGDPSASGRHLATLSHEGRFWDVYLEFTDEPRSPQTCRARLRFSPADRDEREEPLRTTTLIIEPSYEEAMARAEQLEEHHLLSLLRSVLPG